MISKSQTNSHVMPGILSGYLVVAIVFELNAPFRHGIVRALNLVTWDFSSGLNAIYYWLMAQLDTVISFMSSGYYSSAYGVYMPFSAGFLPVLAFGLVFVTKIIRHMR